MAPPAPGNPLVRPSRLMGGRCAYRLMPKRAKVAKADSCTKPAWYPSTPFSAWNFQFPWEPYLCGHNAGFTPIAPPDSLSANGISRNCSGDACYPATSGTPDCEGGSFVPGLTILWVVPLV